MTTKFPIPPSLVAEDIRTLIAYGFERSRPRPTSVQHTNVRVKTAGVSERMVMFELDPRRTSWSGGVTARQIYRLTTKNGRVSRIVDVSPEVLHDVANIQAWCTRVLKPLDPPIMCALRAYVLADGSPLVTFNDERTDALILSIGNIGKGIEWEPGAPPGYKPEWFAGMDVM